MGDDTSFFCPLDKYNPEWDRTKRTKRTRVHSGPGKPGKPGKNKSALKTRKKTRKTRKTDRHQEKRKTEPGKMTFCLNSITKLLLYSFFEVQKLKIFWGYAPDTSESMLMLIKIMQLIEFQPVK